MKRSLYISIAVSGLMTMFSCQKPDLGDTDNVSDGNVKINVTTKASEQFVSGSKAADKGTYYATYFFNPSGTCIKGHQGQVSEGYSYSYSINAVTGEYTIASLVGYASGETIPSSGLTMDYVLDFPKTLHNLYLGSTTVNVIDGQNEYDAKITASRLMAVLTVNLENVPSEVKTVSITLPSQASQFTLKGTVSGTGTSQTFSLIKGAEDTEVAGTYTWSADKQVIYPSADGCTKMPLEVSVTLTDGRTISYTADYEEKAEGKTCCTRGTNTTLTSVMDLPSLSSSITIDETFTATNVGSF